MERIRERQTISSFKQKKKSYARCGSSLAKTIELFFMALLGEQFREPLIYIRDWPTKKARYTFYSRHCSGTRLSGRPIV
jgi:hypothetical protein